jgi:hypothetical protein
LSFTDTTAKPKESVARFLEKRGLTAVILDEQAKEGGTPIEKPETLSIQEDTEANIYLTNKCQPPMMAKRGKLGNCGIRATSL